VLFYVVCQKNKILILGEIMNEVKRLSALDSLRGIAACGVAFFWHYQHFQPKEGFPFQHVAQWFYTYGMSLVDLFFILSGFIFCYVYKDMIAQGKISFNKFSLLRLTRLYPLHVLTLLFVTVMQSVRYLTGQDAFVYKFNDIYHFVLNLFFLQSGWFENGFSFNAPSWSIACEVLAYILFFSISYWLHKNKRYIFAYIGMVLLGLFVIKTNANLPLFNGSMARVFVGFFIGCLLYELNLVIQTREKIRKPFLIGCFMMLISVTISVSAYGNDLFGNWMLVHTILIFPIILILVLNVGFLRKSLSIKPLAYLGDISYSIYLWHFPVQIVMKTIDDVMSLQMNYSSKKVFLLVVLITITVSIISYEFVEKPLLKRFRKFMVEENS
jgi:peptidoglycan/LPS O-acetylase OafA/YrhL